MRYKELLGRARTSLFWLGFFFVLLVIVDICAQIYAYQNSSNQLVIIIATGLNEGITPVLLLFIGAGIAVIAGYFTSISTMELEIGKTRDNLIIGFYYEIKALQEKFEDIPVDNYTNCLAHLKRYKMRFYSEKGLYFELKKELFSLDSDILEKILSLYPKIIHIDELIDFDATVSGFVSADVVNIHSYVNEIKLKLNELFTQLDAEKKKMVK